jgi:glycosyltransferase involved in cell wall biosynthesis
MSIRASVAMAVYNGEKFLQQQIDSIIEQLGASDELVISVDPSDDNSKEVALEYAKDSRVRVFDGPGRGAIKNFENALRHVKGEYIFLSDQDDVWDKNKISEMLSALAGQNVYAAVHDAYVTDEDLKIISETFFEISFYPGIIKNIIKNRYIGCCMAFKREVLQHALPFPGNLPMHDQWIGIIARKLGEVVFVPKPLIYYRRHQGTVTGQEKAGIIKKLKWRTSIIWAILSVNTRKRDKR